MRSSNIRTGSDLRSFVSKYEGMEADDPAREHFRVLYESIKKQQYVIDRSSVELTNGRIFLDELNDFSPDLSGIPLSILNMCESAQITPLLSESFVDFFLDSGVRSVLGTECIMTVNFAHAFAQELLQ